MQLIISSNETLSINKLQSLILPMIDIQAYSIGYIEDFFTKFVRLGANFGVEKDSSIVQMRFGDLFQGRQ